MKKARKGTVRKRPVRANDWRKYTVGELVDAFVDYVALVQAGADPIEAIHGHVCGPNCWHQQMKNVGRK